MEIEVVQRIEVPEGDYCIHHDNNVYCNWAHNEYAYGCWVWRDSECVRDDDYNQLKCAECLRAAKTSD